MLIRTRWFSLSRRDAVLVIFGLCWLLIGWSYLHIPDAIHPQLKRSLRFALSVAPIDVYAWGWILAGALAVLGGVFRRCNSLGFAAAVVMPLLWSLAYFTAQVQDNIPRAWVSGVIFGSFAAVLAVVAGMPEPPLRGLRVRGAR